MAHRRDDLTGSVTIEYDEGEITHVIFRWQETLESDEVVFTRTDQETFTAEDLSTAQKAKLHAAIGVAKVIRDDKFPLITIQPGETQDV